MFVDDNESDSICKNALSKSFSVYFLVNRFLKYEYVFIINKMIQFVDVYHAIKDLKIELYSVINKYHKFIHIANNDKSKLKNISKVVCGSINEQGKIYVI